MNRRKRLFAFIMILTVTLFCVYAGADWENVLLCQPTNVINNQNVMVEMSQAKSIQSTVFDSVTYSAPYKSSYVDQGDIVLFTLIDTLDSSKNSSTITFSIESDNAAGFFFVKDGNETNTVRYELEACFIEFEKETRWFTVNYPKTNAGKKLVLNTAASCGERKSTQFSYNGSDEYTLTIPTTSYSSLWGLGISGNYPQHIRFYYVCIKILGGQNLEEGTYTTSFHISYPGLAEPEKYTIKGYVGEKPVTDSTDFSFFIDPGNDSYFTNLVVAKGDNSPAKDIASLQFYYTRRNTYSSDPNSGNLRKKFTIYISPTNTYSDDTRYVFKKTGTENQSDSFANRIYYEIDTTNTTGLTKYNNLDNTYYFYPEYTFQLISSSGSSKTYQEFWKLEDKHIFIMVSEDSKEEMDEEKMHSIGTYTSNIYFTIVPNDNL